jgi:hypothetical protein
MKKVIGIIAGLTVTGMLGLAAPATATPNDGSEEPGDWLFKNSLQLQGLLFNFPLQKYQAKRYCDDVVRGGSSLEAVEKLMDRGGYSWDVANGISAAASAYCFEAISAAV